MPTTNSNLLPATTGLGLGNLNQKWSAYVTNVFADSIASNAFGAALSGFLRLADGDTLVWRNHANTNDLTLISKNTSDQLVLGNGNGIVLTGANGLNIVAFSATPIFTPAQTFNTTFKITLSGNVTSSVVVNLIAGFVYTFMIQQDATGSRTFVWPVNALNPMTVDPAANAISVQSFIYDGAFLYPTSAGTVN
jgi:hypothetical protein